MRLPQERIELQIHGMVTLYFVVIASILLIPTVILGDLLALVGQLMRGGPRSSIESSASPSRSFRPLRWR
jgi:hypothetical protein